MMNEALPVAYGLVSDLPYVVKRAEKEVIVVVHAQCSKNTPCRIESQPNVTYRGSPAPHNYRPRVSAEPHTLVRSCPVTTQCRSRTFEQRIRGDKLVRPVKDHPARRQSLHTEFCIVVVPCPDNVGVSDHQPHVMCHRPSARGSGAYLQDRGSSHPRPGCRCPCRHSCTQHR